MQDTTVYLASKTEEENQILKRKLEILQDDFPKIRFIGLHPQGLALSAHERMAAVVINIPEWTGAEIGTLHHMREAGYTGPILVTAKAVSPQEIRRLRAMDSVVFLEKPFVAKDLVGIMQKMLKQRAVAQRVHRRFATDESAEIEPYGRNDRYASRVVNLSKGGALLEFLSPTPLRVGDMVRMTMELKKVNRVYTMPARVVWTQKPEAQAPRDGAAGVGVGVEFVGAPDVKKTIFGIY